jgi:hypothetical protein
MARQVAIGEHVDLAFRGAQRQPSTNYHQRATSVRKHQSGNQSTSAQQDHDQHHPADDALLPAHHGPLDAVLLVHRTPTVKMRPCPPSSRSATAIAAMITTKALIVSLIDTAQSHSLYEGSTCCCPLLVVLGNKMPAPNTRSAAASIIMIKMHADST